MFSFATKSQILLFYLPKSLKAKDDRSDMRLKFFSADEKTRSSILVNNIKRCLLNVNEYGMSEEEGGSCRN